MPLGHPALVKRQGDQALAADFAVRLRFEEFQAFVDDGKHLGAFGRVRQRGLLAGGQKPKKCHRQTAEKASRLAMCTSGRPLRSCRSGASIASTAIIAWRASSNFNVPNPDRRLGAPSPCSE